MKYFLPSALSFFFIFLISNPIFSQTKKGFKYLKKEKFEAAAKAFQPDTSSAELGLVAKFGMAQALGNPKKNPVYNFVKADSLLDWVQIHWTKKLTSAQRTQFSKDWEISSSHFTTFSRQLVKDAWSSKPDSSKSLKMVDDFIKCFPKSDVSLFRKAQKLQPELLKKEVESDLSKKDYGLLSHILNTHLATLKSKYPSKVELLQNFCFEKFLQKPAGVDNLKIFAEENPEHPASKDSGREDFPAAYKSENLKPKLTFISMYGNGYFVDWIRKSAIVLLKSKPVTEAEKSGFSEIEKTIFRELEWESKGNSVDVSKEFEEKDQIGWEMFIRQLAPSDRAFLAFKKMNQAFLWKRTWKKSVDVLHFGAPLFPKKEVWFADMLTILEAPDLDIQPVNLGNEINSPGNEYVPVPSADGQKLYFGATGRDENPFPGEDILVSTRTEKGWGKPEIVKNLSLPGNQDPLFLSPDGNQMVIFNSGKANETTRTATGWSEPKPLNIPGLANFSWVGVVQYSANKLVAIFEAKKSENVDFYVVKKDEKGIWGKPEPLAMLNTLENERSPFLHFDNETMYFSSEGHAGLGNLDVFKTKRLDDTWLNWSKPENLGKEVNTPGEDWSYVISTDGKTAYFAQKNENDNSDLYMIALPDSMRPEQVRLVSVEVVDAAGKPISGEIQLINNQTNVILGRFVASEGNQFTTITLPDNANYSVVFEKEGYFPASKSVPPPVGNQVTEVRLQVFQMKLGHGKGSELQVFFDYDKADLKSESLPELQRVAVFLKKKNQKIRLVGYTDDSGTEEYNRQLSARRAEAVRQEFIKMGLLAENMEAVGRGEENPLDTGQTEEAKAINRRVEVEFLN